MIQKVKELQAKIEKILQDNPELTNVGARIDDIPLKEFKEITKGFNIDYKQGHDQLFASILIKEGGNIYLWSEKCKPKVTNELTVDDFEIMDEF